MILIQTQAKVFVLAIFILIPTSVWATSVYKCQQGDQIVFSQMPCEDDNSENKKLDYSSQPQNVVASSNSAQQYSNTNNNATAKAGNTSLFLLERKKARAQTKLTQLKSQYSQEMDKIHQKAMTAGVNRAGESYLKLLTKQVESTKAKYEQKIVREEKKLKKIEQDMARLAQQ